MPQVKAEHRGALVQFLKGRGVQHQVDEVPASSLKPTQAEFSPRKVQGAKEFTGSDRSILVSSDGHVLDGHHQWKAKLDDGLPVKIIRLDAPIQDLLRLTHQFPSSTVAAGGPRRSGGERVGNVDPAAAQAAGAGDGRGVDAGGSGLAVGPVPGAPGPVVPPAAPAAAGSRTPAPVADGGRRDQALSDLQAGLRELGNVLGRQAPAPAPAPSAPTPAPAASQPPVSVDYPNRALGFRKARTDPQDAYDGRGMAQVALANARPGDRFPLGAGVATIRKTTDKLITFDLAGVQRSVRVDSPTWEQLVRDVDGRITSSQHGADPLDVLKALQRDPAFTRDERGLPMLRDPVAAPTTATFVDAAIPQQTPQAPRQEAPAPAAAAGAATAPAAVPGAAPASVEAPGVDPGADLRAKGAGKQAARRASHPRTVMGSELLADVSAGLRGLDPSLMSEFSFKVETSRTDRNGRPKTQWRNPLIPGVGRLFRAGGAVDYELIAQWLEGSGYLEPGSVAADSKAAGERAKDLIRAALNREEIKTLDEQQADVQASQDAEREAYYAQMEAEAAAEAEAEREAIMAEAEIGPGNLDALYPDDIDWFAAEDPRIRRRSGADAMRAMGFTEEEIALEYPEEKTRGTARGGADQARQDGPGQAGQAARARADAPESAGQEDAAEGLTAPTRADVLADQDRRERADELDLRAQVDRERDLFGLQAQAAPETRRDTTGDLFGGPSVADLEAAAARQRAQRPAAPPPDDLLSGLDDQAAPAAPPDTGPFGPILRQYRGDAQGAIKALIELQSGEAVAALNHPDVGDIDLIWGEAGTRESNGSGLAKLVRWHPEVLGDLQGILSAMTVTSRSENRVQLASKTHKAAVRLEWDGRAKTWLLTAFEKRGVGQGTRTDTAKVAAEGDTARPGADSRETVAPPATPADISSPAAAPASTAAPSLPAAVRSRLQAGLKYLQGIRDELDRVKKTGGAADVRITWERYAAPVANSEKRVNAIEAKAKELGIDLAPVVAELGGRPSFADMAGQPSSGAVDEAAILALGFKPIPGMPNGWGQTVQETPNRAVLYNLRRTGGMGGYPVQWQLSRTASFPGTDVTSAPTQQLGPFEDQAAALEAFKADRQASEPKVITAADKVDSAVKQFSALFRDIASGGNWNVYADSTAANGVALYQEGAQPESVTEVLVSGVQGMQARTLANALRAELERRAGLGEIPAAKPGRAKAKPTSTKLEARDSEEVRKAKADLMAGLGDLASILSKPGRMNIVPEDEQRLYPVLVRVFDAAFRLGYLKFKDAAKFVLDQIRGALGDEAASAITLDHLQGAYIGMAGRYTDQGASTKKEVVAVEDLAEIESYIPTQETADVPSTSSNLEPDRQDAADGNAPVVGAVPGDGPADSPAAAGAPAGSSRRGRPDSPSVPAGGAAATREPGDQPVRGADRADGPAEFDAGADDVERSDDPGFDGVSPETVPAAAVAAAAESGMDDARKRRLQREADAIAVVDGDLDNIRRTLPYLLPGQQEDVHKTELRFAKPDGYGMLFTNGTGTGKTFTGLGVSKRFARKGKLNQLIIVPDDKIMADWVDSGRALGLTLTPLRDTKDAGTGITITTYANAGANDALATREWDLVLPDEAHSLMQAAEGEETLALATVRALTYHPRGEHARFAMLNRDDIELRARISDQITANDRLRNHDDTMDQVRDALAAENEKLQAQWSVVSARLDKARAKNADRFKAMQGADRPRLLALSATPFAYESSVDWAEGYLFEYGPEPTSRGYNTPSAQQQFMIERFGYRMRTGKLNKPDAKVDSGLMQRQFNSWLKREGSLAGRMLDVAADYDRRFVLVESAVGNAIDAAMAYLEEQASAQNKEDRAAPNGWAMLRSEISEELYGPMGHLVRRYLLEAIKAKEAIPIIRKHLALGRKVVVFHDFNKGGSKNPFSVQTRPVLPKSAMARDMSQADYDKYVADTQARNLAVLKFGEKFAMLTEGSALAELISPIERFTREFPDVLLINGLQKKGELLQRYKRFNDDAQGPIVALVQSDKNKGWSGHDTTGKYQRVLINLGLPAQPTKSIQTEGRIYRTGQVSDAIMRYLNTGTNWERWAFAQTIATRSSTAENLGMGELARALKDAFISAFEESDAYPPGHEGEGKGGKERDRLSNNALSEYDRAKAFYWGTQKKNSRTKAQEGADYFATPEPLGLKMVQWADARPGEDAIEPSGGHGAIARWFGERVNRTAVEPSAELASRLALVFDGKIIQGRFEDLDIINKYDTAAMNPPFGTAGRLAIDHLAKTARHIREYGRIVALIPEGSATEKFNKWFYEEDSRPIKPLATHPTLGPIYAGDTVETGASFAPAGRVASINTTTGEPLVMIRVAGKTYDSGVPVDAIRTVKPTGKRTEAFKPAEGWYMAAEIKLPGVTFERAGTGVRTRVVVLDKLPKEATPLPQQRFDLSDAKDINELFDRLENIEVRKRQKVELPEIPEIASRGPVELQELQSLAEIAPPDARAQWDEAITALQAGDPMTAAAKAEAAARAWDYVVYRTQAAKLAPRLRKMPRVAEAAKREEARAEGEGAAQDVGLPVVEHITQKGKTIRGGIVRHLTKPQAQEIDPYTWAKNGGLFIRLEHLPKLMQKYPPPPDPNPPAFSRRGGAPTPKESNALKALAENDDLFALPKSSATTLRDIGLDIAPDLEVTRAPTPPGVSEAWSVRTAGGQVGKLYVRKPNPFGPTLYGFDLDDGEISRPYEGRPGNNPDDVDPDTEDVYIDVSKLSPGQGGAQIYAMAAAYAHNTGRIFIGDPAGLSEDAMRRRAENMLSSALRYGTTRHLAPHPQQTAGAPNIGVPPLSWTYGDDLGNVRRLIDLNVAALDNAFPETAQVTFDVSTGEFRNAKTGAVLDAGAIQRRGFRLRQDGLPAAERAAAGGRTIARGAVWRALLREEGAAGPPSGRRDGLLDRLVLLGAKPDSGLERLFKRPESEGESQRAGAQAIQAAVQAALAGWANRPQVITVANPQSPGVDKDIRDADARQRAGGAAPASGVYWKNTVYLFTDGISSPQEAMRTLHHEVLGHFGMRSVFGEALKPMLDKLATLNSQRVEQKAIEYGIGRRAEAGFEYGSMVNGRWVANPEKRFEAAEEVLAQLAETRPTSTWVQRAVAAIRTWLRDKGLLGLFTQDQRLTDDELIRLFLTPARNWVERGRLAEQGGEPVFQRAPDQFGAAPAPTLPGQRQQPADAPRNGTTSEAVPASAPVGRSAGDIAGERDADALRSRAAAAERQRAERLWAKGLSGADEGREAADASRDRVDAARVPGIGGVDGGSDPVGGNQPPLGGDGDARFSRRKPPLDPITQEAMRRAGVGAPAGVRQRLGLAFARAMQLVSDRNELASQVRQGVLDQFYGVKRAVTRDIGALPAEQDPYVAARLANGGASGVMRALLLHGQARWAKNRQHLEKIEGTKGLLEIFEPLGDDLNEFFGWMVGHRAERLKREGRENNLTQEHIDALKALGTPERLQRFKTAAAEYAAFKRSVLDVAQSAGLIDPESRRAWDHADYIPFYRQIDERAVFAATGRKGLSGQSSGIRMLRGGDAALNDPMENLLMNFSRLIDASLKNNAINKTIRALEDAGSDAATKTGLAMTAAFVPTGQVRKLLVESGTAEEVLDAIPEDVFEGIAKMWAVQAPSDPDIVRVMRGGKAVYYRVNDHLLLQALTSFVPFDFPGLSAMRAAKRLLTAAVTAAPEFMIRNWVRDSVAAQAITRNGFNPAKSVTGIVKSFKESGAYEAMLFAGASFQSGNVNAGDPKATGIAMRRALRQKGMDAASIDGFMATLIDSPARFWERYREIGEAIENANREAVYEATAAAVEIDNGQRVDARTRAAYEAKDLMDFSLRGSWAAYQLLADVLPFFNARVQGLYRLGRSDPKRLMTVGLTLTAASLLLAMGNDKEDWYEKLPDWDKDTNWHFRIGGEHFRVPKPFELGVIFATIPERIGRALKGMDDGEKTAERLWANVRDQLAVDPVPQLFRPALNVWANWDTFRDAPIEGMRDEGKLPHLRYGATTSDTTRVLADAAAPLSDGLGLSPKRLEYLVGGYFGTAGLYALGLSDMLVRQLEGQPPRPSLRADDIPVVRAFYRVDPARATVFESDLYKMRREVDELYRSITSTFEDNPEKALELYAENKAKLDVRAVVTQAVRAINEITKERDRIIRDPNLSPDEKRRQVDALQERRNAIAQRVVTNPRVSEAF